MHRNNLIVFLKTTITIIIITFIFKDITFAESVQVINAEYSEAELRIDKENQFDVTLFWVDLNTSIHLPDGTEITDLSLEVSSQDNEMPPAMLQQFGSVRLICDCINCVDTEECIDGFCEYESYDTFGDDGEEGGGGGGGGAPKFFMPMPAVKEPASVLFEIFAEGNTNATVVHNRFIGAKITRFYDNWKGEWIDYVPEGWDASECSIEFLYNNTNQTAHFVTPAANTSSLVFEPIGPLTTPNFVETQYVCEYGKIDQIFSDLLQDISLIGNVDQLVQSNTRGAFDKDFLEFAVWHIASYEALESMIACKKLATSLVTLGTVNKTVRGDRGCRHAWGTDEWNNDPCCNHRLQFEQCCMPKESQVEVPTITGVDQIAVDATCVNPERAVRTIALLIENQRKARECDEKSAEFGADLETAWPKLTRFIDTCFQKVYGSNGPPSCRVDDDCYTSCAVDRGECVVPWDNPAPAMRSCFVAEMDPELERYLRRKWGLTGASNETEFENAFSLNLEDETCVGPYAWEYQERYEIIQVSTCNDTDMDCWCLSEEEEEEGGDDVWPDHCPAYDPGLGDQCVPAPASVFCDIQPSNANESSECLLVPAACLTANEPLNTDNVDPVSGLPYLDGCAVGTGKNSPKTSECNAAEWTLMCSAYCTPCVLDTQGASWHAETNQCQENCDNATTECGAFWDETSVCSLSYLINGKVATCSSNETCSTVEPIPNATVLQKKRAVLETGEGEKRLSSSRHYFSAPRYPLQHPARSTSNGSVCYRETVIPADPAGCVTEAACNWNDQIKNASECVENPNNPGTDSFCAECHGGSCWEVTQPPMCYTWVNDPANCAVIGGVEGPWGSWHCVFPNKSQSASDCVPGEYCYVPSSSNSTTNNTTDGTTTFEFEKHCGGVCVATVASNQSECEDLNEQQTKRIRNILQLSESELDMDSLNSHYVCKNVIESLKRSLHTLQRVNGPNFRKQSIKHDGGELIRSIDTKMHAIESSISSAAQKCSIELEIDFSEYSDTARKMLSYTSFSTPTEKRDEITGLHEWNFYYWESNVETGDGYCQVGNLWGPSQCNGTALEWIPYKVYQRGMFDTQTKCDEGRCSIDDRMTADECNSTASCTKPCRKCRSSNWGSSLCFDPTITNTSLCIEEGGDMNTELNACLYEYLLDHDSCLAGGNNTRVFQQCEDLDLDTCSLCASGDSSCPVHSVLGCYINRWDTCNTKEECESSGQCPDWEFHNWNNPLCWEQPNSCGGVCVLPFNTSRGHPECDWSAGQGWSQIGCIDHNIITKEQCDNVTLSDNNSTGGLWKTRANTKEECDAHGMACVEPRFLGFTPKTEEQCSACDGTFERYYKWTWGEWYTGVMTPLQWKTNRSMEAVNRWDFALNWTKFHNQVSESVAVMMGKALKSRSECKYNLVSSNVKALACECGVIGPNETCSVDDSLVVSIGEAQFFSGLEKKVAMGEATMQIGSDDIPPDVDSSIITVKTVTDLDTLLTQTTKRLIEVEGERPFNRVSLRSSQFFLRDVAQDYAVVMNEIGGQVGQLVGTGFSVDFEEGSKITTVRICLPIDFDIPHDNDTWPVPDLAIFANDTYTALGIDPIEIEDDSHICGSVSEEGMYFPVYREVGNWTAIPPCKLDACNVCNGDNSTCEGCDGVPNSGLVNDTCGVCGGDNSTCVCCPGMIGEECDIEDKCYDVTCLNDGVCDPLDGQCACPSQWIGEFCELPRCSGNGIYNLAKSACLCYRGWAGVDCSICNKSPFEDHVYLCLPLLEGTDYTLMAVKEGSASQFLDGKAALTVTANRSAIRPNTVGSDGITRDCRCKRIETQSNKKKSIEIKRQDKIARARQARHILDQQIQEKNNRIRDVFETMLRNRFKNEANDGVRGNKKMSATTAREDLLLRIVKSTTEDFFVELLDTILEEVELTENETQAFTEFYEECLEHHFEDKDKSSINFETSFYILLPLAIVFTITTVLLIFIMLSIGLSNRNLRKKLDQLYGDIKRSGARYHRIY